METKGVAHKLDAKERTDDVRLKELAPFSKMLLSESVRKGLHAAGFMYPTVIQATAIPVGKSGMDLLVQSKSGTGKTLIFSTIVLEFYRSDLREPQSLIVAPTREIAVQIEEILNEIGKYCAGFRAVCVIGGMDVAEDRKRLQVAKCVVGTPGRILHLIQNEVLNTSQISLLVLDEADKMYTQTFRQDLQRIRKALPNRKQTIACSATFVDNLDKELAKIMKNPLLISTEERATLLVGIKQFVYELPEQKTSILEMQQKLEALRHLFGRIAFKQCLIFAGSQSRADSYRNYLEKDGWPCELISGAQDQKTRLENFRKFREFKTRILIATDLMARGVDSEHVNLVINLELPPDVVTYLHRIGRAGRFGSHGLAISFVASEKDHKTFRKLITEVGTGMKVFKFPSKDQSEKEPRDLWNFGEFAEDVKYFGVYQSDMQKLLAPLASQDNITLSSSLSDNKENLTNNISSQQQSSIDTNTFLVNSKDSALQVPNLSSEQFIAQKIALSPTSYNEALLNDLPPLGTPPPPPNPSENLNTAGESHNSSSHHLLTSNTIDDASSIAADSLRSSQQDISRYQSVLMQKSAIPTLVEFLVDRHSSQDSQTKENGEPCTKIDLFDAYTKEVLNNNESLTEPAITSDEPLLSSNKLAQLKSLLIDKPDEKSPINEVQDLYSDFANFQEDDISTSVSEDIDKQTFILSVATPSVQQDSFSELQNNSSDLYPATDETNISTRTPRGEKEHKHFPSPAHNQMSEFMPDILSGQMQKNKPQQQHQKLQQKLSINKTAQIEIPPYQSPPNSVSPLVNAVENNENNSTPSTERSSSDSADSPPEEDLDNSGSDVERSGNTSGFDEKTSTSGSSGIESSEHNNATEGPRQVPLYYTSSEDDSCESDDEDEEEEEEEEEEEDDDDDESEHYFNTDEEAEEEDEDDENDFVECFENTMATNIPLNHTRTTTTRNHSSNSSNTLTNATPDSLNLAYQLAYSRWVDLYWNQMTLVQDYVKFFQFTRQQQQQNK
ncbi:DEAD-box ATP-dependent RNA helicase 24 [Lucilia cuprina]|uniref:DEAD-box ATP-dependent RNA helicase 24 n=1 Tax=Lucilia cuprina TaxID=7375 RepID=UPI001F052F82|nr:DEAD-box ATP-dependent RNA helicase 24 [Lucilia cuprina]